MTNFKEKYGPWALVTGATSGIGEQLADQLAAAWLNIVLVARKEKELIQKAKLLSEKHHIKTATIPADLSTTKGVEQVISESKAHEIGLLVLAAGLEVNGAFEKNDISKEMQVLQLNVVSTVALSHHFIGPMIGRGKGGILMVASLSGHMPNPYFANYAGSKAFVLNFGASLYGEMKPKGVDIAVLSPGLTQTPMSTSTGVNWRKTPMKAMTADAVATAGLKKLGKGFLAVPGFANNVMAGMAKHSPLGMLSTMNEKMMKKAIDPAKL
ncbi:MAG: SDR family NAD(P)-dependent oxidoreductase [Imperialibacter sp.]|uniref:SDR family NAD(P)-dependent oxidoreductase n=1 Tax=Imperialibacter sp. TaxID=2038411 RepID=UPI0032EDDE76